MTHKVFRLFIPLSLAVVYAILRVALEKTKHLDILLTSIAMVSIDYVVLALCNKIAEEHLDFLKKTSLSESIYMRRQHRFSMKLCLFVEFPVLIASVVYGICFSSNMLNDIFSVFALCIEIAEDQIVMAIKDSFD